jgi:hypothetical protein
MTSVPRWQETPYIIQSILNLYSFVSSAMLLSVTILLLLLIYLEILCNLEEFFFP